MRPPLLYRPVLVWSCVSLLLSIPACDEPGQPLPASEGSRVRRVFRPPPDHLRAVPPHAIHVTGVGPYELGMPLQKILDLLPGGPRVVVAQIDDVLDYDVVRADDEAVIVGSARSRPRGVVFVSVLDERIARTEHGIGVGTPLARLREVLGKPAHHPSLAMDPRMVVFGQLPNTRFVLARRGDKRTVAAVTVLRSDPEHAAKLVPPPQPSDDQNGDGPERPQADKAGPAAPAEPPVRDRVPPAAGTQPAVSGGQSGDAPGAAAAARQCGAEPTPSQLRKYLAVARITHLQRKRVQVVPGCFSSAAANEVLAYVDSRVVLIGGDPGKPKRLASYETGAVVYVATLDIDADGRHELAIVSQRVTVGERERERISRIEIMRFESGRLHRLGDRELYRLSTSNTAWVGASLNEIDLLLELWASSERVEVSGLYVHWGPRGRPTNVASLLPVTVPIRRKRNTTAPADPIATAPDSGVPNVTRDAGADTGVGVDAGAQKPDARVPEATTKPPAATRSGSKSDPDPEK